MDKLPNHVAIIMDGNRRWAEQRGLSSLDGHRAGVKSIRPTVEYLAKQGVKYLTVYGFSTENWSRPKDEVEGLFRLFIEVLDKEISELNEVGVRVRHLGRLDELPVNVQEAIKRAVELTADNTSLTLNLAVNYGGRQEIVEAVQRLYIASSSWSDIDESSISRHLYTDGIPDVDLVIRTAGELRLSNFLIWQTAYSEYYFTDALWPDFDIEELEKALEAYKQRCRRYGGD
ncbi:Ditrans,polycis-undecaprenyl-diphosphate synthase ((2E,6E)-farnesyl-diphosphate specific) [subsurface metagenome]